jgi:hypothetical protein
MNTQKNATPAPLLVALSLGIAAAGAGFFLIMGSSQPVPAEASARPPVAVQQAAPAPLPAPVPAIEPSAPPVESPSTSREPPSKASRLARDLEREQIWKALGRKHNLKPAAPGSAAPSESAAALLPSLDRQYVQSAIREQLVPVAIDCYETALEQDSKLSGKVVLNFTIIGDEEVGGVVEAAEVNDETTLDSEFVRECMRESVMAVTFEPPSDGGRVEVTYPFEFSPGD